MKNKGGLGFRKISIFNDGFLVMQSWKILISQYSIMHKSLKAKCFSNLYLRNAKISLRIAIYSILLFKPKMTY